MTDLQSTLQVILQDSGYRTSLIRTDNLVAVCFEDDAVLGFAIIFETVTALLGKWQTVQKTLLARYASHLQIAGDKAWNVYCVFLCSAPADGTQQRELSWIEEDLELTRKIAACGLAGQDDLVGALLPVLPLQYRPVLSTEDLTERLQKRIATISPAASTAALDDAIPAVEIARLLGAPT